MESFGLLETETLGKPRNLDHAKRAHRTRDTVGEDETEEESTSAEQTSNCLRDSQQTW